MTFHNTCFPPAEDFFWGIYRFASTWPFRSGVVVIKFLPRKREKRYDLTLGPLSTSSISDTQTDNRPESGVVNNLLKLRYDLRSSKFYDYHRNSAILIRSAVMSLQLPVCSLRFPHSKILQENFLRLPTVNCQP